MLCGQGRRLIRARLVQAQSRATGLVTYIQDRFCALLGLSIDGYQENLRHRLGMAEHSVQVNAGLIQGAMTSRAISAHGAFELRLKSSHSAMSYL